MVHEGTRVDCITKGSYIKYGDNGVEIEPMRLIVNKLI